MWYVPLPAPSTLPPAHLPAFFQWSGWIIQQYNSGSVAMGALGKELFTYGKPYWLVPFAIFLGLFMPIPFWLVHRFARKDSFAARAAKYINTPIILLYIGYLPYSVNGMWWSCLVIGLASQQWARRRRPGWFKKVRHRYSAFRGATMSTLC